jgi:hypothetical protein
MLGEGGKNVHVSRVGFDGENSSGKSRRVFTETQCGLAVALIRVLVNAICATDKEIRLSLSVACLKVLSAAIEPQTTLFKDANLYRLAELIRPRPLRRKTFNSGKGQLCLGVWCRSADIGAKLSQR